MHATNNVIDSLQEEDTQKGKYLTFSLGDEYYAIEIKYVTEIIGMQPISEVPELPEYVKGIINLRGKIIPVMDVRLRFKKPVVSYNDRTCVIVIEISGISIGLIVDLVSEVMVIPDDDIVPPPEVSQSGNKFIKGIGKVGTDVKLLLDCDRLINENEINLLEESI
ncbi:purine-binding chemotaxis protein CheW [Cohnella endophytica]|uniref:Purine-binding chemotaxis protein CheW n=1 Tax=Cohnella endophytica TaxID=2419778 RepID=A0A494XP30_9BACL|nr:chemotaxis protein CheW [Cohnella endophytica]RKP49889.1 purine-binding chemotaxis protein CheW [Cohnella endophytica]